MSASVLQRTLLFLLLPLVSLMAHVLLPMHASFGWGSWCICHCSSYILLHSAIVIAAFAGSAALCAVLFPVAG